MLRCYIDRMRAFSVDLSEWSKSWWLFVRGAEFILPAFVLGHSVFKSRFVNAQAIFKLRPLRSPDVDRDRISQFFRRYLRKKGWELIGEGKIWLEEQEHYTLTYMLRDKWPTKRYLVCLPHPRFRGLTEIGVTITVYDSLEEFLRNEPRLDAFVKSTRVEMPTPHNRPEP